MEKSTNESPKNVSSVEASIRRIEARHKALLGELADLGLVLRGTIAHRTNRCGNPTCRCKADPPQLHGPYPVWTRKVRGKTVTAVLRPEHAPRLEAWSANMRKLDAVVRELQELGLEAAVLLRGK